MVFIQLNLLRGQAAIIKKQQVNGKIALVSPGSFRHIVAALYGSCIGDKIDPCWRKCTLRIVI